MATMAEIIKQLRLEHNMTQEELGRHIGVQKSAIRKYESGRVQNIPRSSIEKMASLFNVRPSYLMGFEEPKTKLNLQLFASDTEEIKKAPDAISEETLKIALFGGDTEVTDEMWKEVMNYAEYIKQKYGKT